MSIATAALLLATQAGQAPQSSDSKGAMTASSTSAVDSRRVGDTRVGYMMGSTLPKEAEWKPLTNRERWGIYYRQTWANPGVLFRAFGSAAGDQAGNEPPQWGQGGDAYARRVGSRFATFAIQDTLQTAVAAGMQYDVRYLRCKCEGFFPRVGHAMMQSFVTKNRDGKWRPNIPNWVGGMGGTAIAVYGWYPDGARNHNEIWRQGATQLAFPMFFNTLIEFGPELKKLFRR